HAGRGQRAILRAAKALGGQFTGQSLWQGVSLLRPALAGEVVDDLRQEPLQVRIGHAPILPAPPAPPYNSRARQELFMRVVLSLFMLLCSFAVVADDHVRLYQSAGWPQQQGHFG